MGKSLSEVTEDIQDRIREAAYLMWESAGRQHGLAMEYWLKAESDMLSTMQAATANMISSMLPGRGGKSTAETPGTVPATVATPATAEPVAANPPPPVRQQAEPAQTLAVEASPAEVRKVATADAPATDKKQAAVRKPAVRSKLKA